MRKSSFVGVFISALLLSVLLVPKSIASVPRENIPVDAAGSMINQSEPGVSAPTGESCNELVFDLRNTMHVVDGFGVHMWADQAHGMSELPNLNIKYIRITHDNSSLEDLKKARAFTDRHGIKWLYMLWRAPRRFVNDNNCLVDVAGFADHWCELVAYLDQNGLRPHYIELMNEPDSDGSWSTRITPADYAKLVELTRDKLDKKGFRSVGIVGPGLAHLNWDNHNSEWVEAMGDSVAGLAAWSTHCWDDGDLCREGAPCIDQQWPEFGKSIGKYPAKPIWITEYGSKEVNYNGNTYPHPDETSGYSCSQSMPYAVRVCELSLSLLNKGANVLFYWHAEDMGKSWGYVDDTGKRKPVFHVLSNVYPKISPGSRVVKPSAQPKSGVYGAAFLRQERLVIALANDHPVPGRRKVQVKGCRGLRVVQADACVAESIGEPSTKKTDVCRVTSQKVELLPENRFDLTLPGYSTLTIVCEVTFEQSQGDGNPK